MGSAEMKSVGTVCLLLTWLAETALTVDTRKLEHDIQTRLDKIRATLSKLEAEHPAFQIDKVINQVTDQSSLANLIVPPNQTKNFPPYPPPTEPPKDPGSSYAFVGNAEPKTSPGQSDQNPQGTHPGASGPSPDQSKPALEPAPVPAEAPPNTQPPVQPAAGDTGNQYAFIGNNAQPTGQEAIKQDISTPANVTEYVSKPPPAGRSDLTYAFVGSNPQEPQEQRPVQTSAQPPIGSQPQINHPQEAAIGQTVDSAHQTPMEPQPPNNPQANGPVDLSFVGTTPNPSPNNPQSQENEKALHPDQTVHEGSQSNGIKAKQTTDSLQSQGYGYPTYSAQDLEAERDMVKSMPSWPPEVRAKFKNSYPYVDEIAYTSRKILSGVKDYKCPYVAYTDCNSNDVSDRYRTFDGRCNNKKYPMWGAFATPLARFFQPKYEDGYHMPRGARFKAGTGYLSRLPSAR